MHHDFRQQLLAGRRLIGTLVSLNSPEVIEILIKAGFDWLFIDAEHSPLDAGSLQKLLQAAGPHFPCVIRVPDHSEMWIKRALDIGAAGIIVPQVNTAEQAKKIVGYAKYAPEGNRGVGLARAHGYGFEMEDYINQANDSIAVIVQAENILAVENIDAIAEIKGVDAVLIGPYDLSASMGKLGQVTDPEVAAAIDNVTSSCRERGVCLGIFGLSADAVENYVNRGFTLLTVGIDAVFLGNEAKNTVEKVRQL